MKIIGTTTTYTGHEIPGLKGACVRIFAVLRDALRPGVDVDAEGHFVTDDAALAELGGVTEYDRVDVAPLHHDGRASFVHYDARALDLECFVDLDVKGMASA